MCSSNLGGDVAGCFRHGSRQVLFPIKAMLWLGLVSTWKQYKSTVVQEAFAISSRLRHKRVTVPLTPNHNHMER